MQWVSPWEIERDPEEDAIWEDKRRRAAEAEARAARAARAKGRRCWPTSTCWRFEVLLRNSALQQATDCPTAVPLPAGSAQCVDDMTPTVGLSRLGDDAGAQLQRGARAGSATPGTAAAGQAVSGTPEHLGVPGAAAEAQQDAGSALDVGRGPPDERGGEVPAEVLDAIRPLDRDQLTCLLTNYLLSVRGAPSFRQDFERVRDHEPLDLADLLFIRPCIYLLRRI